MRLVVPLGWAVVAGCDPSPFTNGCLDRHLDRWCNHDSEADGATEGGCADPALPDGAPDGSCGDYVVTSSGPNLSGVDHYFLDGEHVATAYWKDVNTYCGDYVFWYGQRVRCD